MIKTDGASMIKTDGASMIKTAKEHIGFPILLIKMQLYPLILLELAINKWQNNT